MKSFFYYLLIIRLFYTRVALYISVFGNPSVAIYQLTARVRSHTISQSLKKRLMSIGRKKYSKNTIPVLRNASMTSWQAMNRGFTRMSPKVNSCPLYGFFKMSQIHHARSTSKQMIACFFSEKLDMSQSYHYNNAEQSILSGTQPFVCQLSSKKLGKPTAKDGLLQALTHRLK